MVNNISHTIPIVFCFDDNLLMPAGICLSSLALNAHPETQYDIFILHSNKYDFATSYLADFPKHYPNCKITFRTVTDEFLSAFEIRGITTTAYYRLLIPEIVPEYDKILYSDVDVIFRDDLTRYYETDMTGYHMAGVDNCSVLRPGVQKYLTEKVGIDYRNGYFYSGNLILNSKLIREDKLIPRFRELAKNEYNQQDMDIINIACNKTIKALDPGYCLTVQLNDLIVHRRNEMLTLWSDDILNYAMSKGIVHYNGQKPWKGYCPNFDIWWEYYRKSPYFDEKFYFEFFYSKLNELDQLTLWKRIKILARYFIHGRK